MYSSKKEYSQAERVRYILCIIHFIITLFSVYLLTVVYNDLGGARREVRELRQENVELHEKSSEYDNEIVELNRRIERLKADIRMKNELLELDRNVIEELNYKLRDNKTE